MAENIERAESAPITKKDEVKEQRKEKYLERKVEKEKAYEELKKFVDEHKDPATKQKLEKLMQVIRPSLYGLAIGVSSGTSMESRFISLLKEKGTVSEDVVFKELKIGRKECAGYIRNNLRKVKPVDRVWIAFDPKIGLYTVKGKGEKAPQGWNGYIPIDEKIDLK